MLLQTRPEITIDFILSKVTEEQIFEYYLGVPVQYRDNFCSPIRTDNNPTCRFSKWNGWIFYTDWSGHYKGTCFSLVSFLFPELCFPKILEKIVEDLGIFSNNKKTIIRPKLLYINHEVRYKCFLEVESRPWNIVDKQYWSSYGVTKKTLEFFNVSAVNRAWIDTIMFYAYEPSDPGYSYQFKEKDFKIYFPKRKIKRFKSNTTELQGYKQLPETGELLVITKALKDVMCLYENGIPAVAPQAETQLITQEQYEELSERFEIIIMIYDEDDTGIRSVKNAEKYPLIHTYFVSEVLGTYITKKYRIKDIADWSRESLLKNCPTILKIYKVVNAIKDKLTKIKEEYDDIKYPFR